MIYVGIDWADQHHDITCCREGDDSSTSVRIGNDPEGFDELVKQIEDLRSDSGETVCVGIESTEGLLVQRCLSEGYRVYLLNPKVVAEYRNQHRPSRTKSDSLDAQVLMEMIRDHRDRFDPVYPDSELGRECRLLAQDYRKMVQQKTRLVNQITASLKRYFPEALEVFSSVDQPIMMGFLEDFPTLQEARKMSEADWTKWLKEHRHPQYEAKAETMVQILDEASSHRDAATRRAKVRRTLCSVRQLDVLLDSLKDYEQRFEEILEEHPDGEMVCSLPGVGTVLGARLLGELGDNRNRYEDANELQCEAGTAPVTIQSGQTKRVVMRQACRRSFRDTMHQFAFSSLKENKWARALYDRQRDRDKTHGHALRVVAHCWLNIIYTLWKRRECYDKEVHFQNSTILQEDAA
jgi:transposase